MKAHPRAAMKKKIPARECREARSHTFDFERVVGDIVNIHSECIKHAERAVSLGVTLRNWAIGFYIFEYEQRGSDRAQYGARVLDVLSTRLTRDGVDGVATRSLRQYRQFYLAYPELCRRRIGASSSGNLSSPAIWQTVSAKLRELLPARCAPHTPTPSRSLLDPELLLSRLSFSHFAELITIEEQEERAFYEIESIRGAWSVRELSFYLVGGPTVLLTDATWIDCQGNIAAIGTPASGGNTRTHSYLLIRQGTARANCPQ